MTARISSADADIRPVLRRLIAADHADEPDTVILEELGISRGEVRLDLVVVNGALHGFEIKSGRDGLRRLKSQVEHGSRVLDLASLVVAPCHLEKVLQILPDWWGVLCVEESEEEIGLHCVRPGNRNPCLDPTSLAELLWSEPALELLERHGLAVGVRGKPRRFLWERAGERLPVEEIAAAVRAQFKGRAGRQELRPL